eukprot:80130_1
MFRGSKTKSICAKSTDSKSSRWVKTLLAYLGHPYSADAAMDKLLKQRIIDELPMDPIELLKQGNHFILGILLNEFMKIACIGITADKILAEGFQYTNLLSCGIPQSHFKSDCIKTNLSSLVAGLNRKLFVEIAEWKKEHLNNIFSQNDIPEWIRNPPQIDITVGGHYDELKATVLQLIKISLNLRGYKGRKTSHVLTSKQICFISKNIYMQLFGHIVGHQFGFLDSRFDLAALDPSDLFCYNVWFWLILVMGRSGTSLSNINLKRDVDFSTFDNGYISVCKTGKDVTVSNYKKKMRKIKVRKAGTGLASGLKLMALLRPVFDLDHGGFQYKERLFIKPLKKIKKNKNKEGTFVAYARMGVGRGSFDNYIKLIASKFNIKYEGGAYGIRYAIISTLFLVGIPAPQIQKHWSKHSSLETLGGYHDEAITQDDELKIQDRFFQYINDHGNELKENDTNSNSNEPVPAPSTVSIAPSIVSITENSPAPSTVSMAPSYSVSSTVVSMAPSNISETTNSSINRPILPLPQLNAYTLHQLPQLRARHMPPAVSNNQLHQSAPNISPPNTNNQLHQSPTNISHHIHQRHMRKRIYNANKNISPPNTNFADNDEFVYNDKLRPHGLFGDDINDYQFNDDDYEFNDDYKRNSKVGISKIDGDYLISNNSGLHGINDNINEQKYNNLQRLIESEENVIVGMENELNQLERQNKILRRNQDILQRQRLMMARRGRNTNYYKKRCSKKRPYPNDY